MQLDPHAPATLRFTCNNCGAQNAHPAATFHRETAACGSCGANARFRGIIRALALGLGIDPHRPLTAWPRQKQLRGLGMSDWEGYAHHLRDKFDYTNTFYDRPPTLDIQAPATELLGSLDFVITTDVFEHILQPLQTGFDNLCALLKPGGHLVFSVPYTRLPATREHFPDLHTFEIVNFAGERILVNRDAQGRLSARDGLIFHGGEGATLEMRLFCEADLLARLAAAGFTDIVVHDQPDLAVGYYWPPLLHGSEADPRLYAYIITARRPPRETSDTLIP